MTHAKVAAVATACALAAVVTVRAQDQDQAFKAGLNARDDRRWVDVITQMQRAIQIRPMESARKVQSGLLGFVPGGGTEYLPYYFLGDAHYQRGECALAMEAWSRSEQQGVIRGIQRFARAMQAGTNACEQKGILPSLKFEAAVANATQQILQVNAVAGTVVGRAGGAGELFTAERRDQYEQASSEIQEAQSRLDAGKRSRAASDFTEVGNATGRARTILVGLSEGLEAVIAARNVALGELAGVERAIAGADALDREIEGRKWALNDALNATRQLGRDALGRARGRLADLSRSPTTPASPSMIADARRDAQLASSQFGQVLEELTRLGELEIEGRLAQAMRSARDMFAFVGEAFATFDRRAAARQEKVDTTERQAIERRVRTARRQLDTATKSGDAGGIEAGRRSAEQARDQLNVLISAFGPMSLADRGVHPALERGAQLFLNGEHQQALDALNPTDGFSPDMPLLVHVHLFRAAALHGLSLRAGVTDSPLRDQALAEVAEIKALDQAFQPDLRAFSPRFLEFFRGAGAAAEPPAGRAAPATQP